MKIDFGAALMAAPPVAALVTADETDKLAFHRAARAYLKALAKELGLPATSYSIRSNLAGPAVTGEVVLHGEWLYVRIGDAAANGLGVLFRRCQGRQDYTGGINQWRRLADLADLPSTARWVRRVIT